MDILSQYYNSAGQIVSRTPNLATREFYRDYMCRHTFDEMFVAAQVQSGPTCSIVPGFMYYDYYGGNGIKLTIVASSGQSKLIEGYNGRKACVCSGGNSEEIYIGPYGNSWDIYNTWTGSPFAIDSSMNFGSIFKSPSQLPDKEPGLFFCFYLSYLNTIDNNSIYSEHMNNLERIQLDFYAIPYNGAIIKPYINININVGGVDSILSDIAVSDTFLTDGKFHVLSCNIDLNGKLSISVDGLQIYNLNGVLVSRFYRPYIYVLCCGAEDDTRRYAVDSAWIKKI